MKEENKIKVCLIAKAFDLSIGGIGRYAKEMLVRLKDRCHTITISSKRASSIGYFWFSAVEVFFKLPKAEVYHAMSPIEAIHIYKKRNSVVTIHDLLPLLHLNLTKTRYAKGHISRFISKNYFAFACKRAIKCKKIIVDSELTRRHIIKYLGADESKIHVIPIGISSDFKPLSLPKKDRVFRIGIVSYLDQKKRIHLLIEAFRKMEKLTDNVELLIGGAGDDEKRLRSLAIGTNTRFLGFIPDKDLCGFYNSLDLFVFPTINEGQGLPIIEAIACGKPVITLKDAIMPEEIQSHTIVANSENLDEVILKLKNINYKQTQENIKWAQSYSLDKMADETFRIYKEMIE